VRNIKFWLIFLLLVCGKFGAIGQKFDLGILAGPQAYIVTFPDDDDRDIFDSKIKIGYRAGAYIIFPLENDFAWSSEVFFSKKGRKLENKVDGIVNDATYNFLETSFLLRKEFDLTIIENIKGKWFFNFGPNINYWMGGKGTIDSNVDLDYEVKFEEGKSDLEYNYIIDGNRWLFGLDIGIGIDTPIINSQKFETELRFTLGQTFLGARDGSVPVNEFQNTDNLRAHYRTLSLVLRYGLGIDLKNARKGKSTLKIKNKRRR
jgi:hypothetical protein